MQNCKIIEQRIVALSSDNDSSLGVPLIGDSYSHIQFLLVLSVNPF